MAWLNKAHQEMFEDPRVVFISANLINPVACDAAFQGEDFDWVINAAGETKTGQEKPVYKEGILKVSSNAIKSASEKGVKVYLEVSSGQMNSSDKPSSETDDCDPWSVTGKFKFESEKLIKSVDDLNWIIVRPAIVYGPGDRLGLTPRLLVGAICRYIGTEMKLLWDHNLKMNTVHVRDVARAIVWLCQRGKTKEVYNLVDDGESTQDSISKLIANIFNVSYDFCGTTLSKLAMTEGSSTVQYVNEKHLEPWLKICTSNNLHNTPLTPYIDIEALHNKHINLDGSKLRREGFQFNFPKITIQNLIEVRLCGSHLWT
ncbi:UNVERIFIED_CONTAM: hypothetical protein GTU68_066298 [Idotea baltica]|nr:hypothetical protein [Idotea baltica]